MIQPCSVRRLRRVLAFAAGASLFFQTVEAVTPEIRYTITDLGWFGGTVMIPTGLNSSGAVVGFGAIPSGDRHAFLFNGGSLSDLGTQGQQQSWAVGINDSGTVLGQAGDSSVNTTFTYSGGTFQSLPATFAEVAAINNSGLIAGKMLDLGQYRAVSYDGLQFTSLETTAYSSSSTAINAAGDIIGTIYPTSTSPTTGFLYSGGTMTLLGTLGGDRTWTYGLNDLGQVVGTSEAAANDWRPFLYSGGSMIELGTSGTAWDINNSGQIVGTASRAFVISDGTQYMLEDVTDFGATNFVTLDEARVINDSGQIAGFGTTAGGDRHAYLLTPLTAVPEPGAWGIAAALSLAGLGALRRARAHRTRAANATSP